MELNRIRIILAERNLKNVDLCNALEVTPTTLSSWVNNRSQPHVSKFFEMAVFFKINLEDLFISKEDFLRIKEKNRHAP